MLTIRKIRVPSGDWAAARRAAKYPLAFADSPEAYAYAGDSSNGEPDRAETTVHAIWLGSPRMLAALGVDRGEPVSVRALALALQGRNVDGDRVRREGWIHRPAVDQHGRPVYDEQGNRGKVRVLGTKSVDLTFSAPKSVSVIWSQAKPELRPEIEQSMLAASDAMVTWMTRSKPVVAHGGALVTAHGFAAAAALHVTARTAQGDRVPSPQLHVHVLLLGVERPDGLFAAPELSGLFMRGAPLEGGAVGRLKLAEMMIGLGFEIDCGTGRGSRYFEIANVPPGLIGRLSGRTRDVEIKIEEREAWRSTALTNEERAIAALQTRAPKPTGASPAETSAIWTAHADDFDFGPGAVDALRHDRGFIEPLAQRHATVRTAAVTRIQAVGLAPASGPARAAVFESAVGRLRLEETFALLEELERA